MDDELFLLYTDIRSVAEKLRKFGKQQKGDGVRHTIFRSAANLDKMTVLLQGRIDDLKGQQILAKGISDANETTD